MKSIKDILHKIGNDPFVDWVVIFSSSILLAVIFIIIGICVYINGASALSSAPATISANSSASSFDVQKLNRIVGAFDARANERVLLEKAYVGPQDPSLP
jgi:hypothetical protein